MYYEEEPQYVESDVPMLVDDEAQDMIERGLKRMLSDDSDIIF